VIEIPPGQGLVSRKQIDGRHQVGIEGFAMAAGLLASIVARKRLVYLTVRT
jgi:hypothetical protein